MKEKDIENLKSILVDLEDAENGAIINLSQEEINGLKSILEILKSSISKEKIREKIKNDKENIETLYNSANFDSAYVRAEIERIRLEKEVLEELLEEN